MFNLHLLENNLPVDEYKEVMSSIKYDDDWQRLPAYVIARCPYCFDQSIEKLDTYTSHTWRSRIVPTSRLGFSYYKLVVHHCSHFALAQFFFHFPGKVPDKLKYLKKAPYIIGHLLESGRCLAVLHALPVCEIEDNTFVPRYTLLLFSYFSKQPDKAIQDIERYNMDFYNLGEATLDLPLQFGEKYWADLSNWVRKGHLYWVDGNDPDLGIRTHDVDAFPYGDLTSDG